MAADKTIGACHQNLLIFQFHKKQTTRSLLEITTPLPHCLVRFKPARERTSDLLMSQRLFNYLWNKPGYFPDTKYGSSIENKSIVLECLKDFATNLVSTYILRLQEI